MRVAFQDMYFIPEARLNQVPAHLVRGLKEGPTGEPPGAHPGCGKGDPSSLSCSDQTQSSAPSLSSTLTTDGSLGLLPL